MPSQPGRDPIFVVTCHILEEIRCPGRPPYSGVAWPVLWSKAKQERKEGVRLTSGNRHIWWGVVSWKNRGPMVHR